MIVFKVTHDLNGLRRSEFNAALKATWRIVGEDYHSRFMAKHFTHQGAKEYGYAPRKGERGSPGSKGFRRSYTGRKLARFGHTLPLVYTGESRSLARIRDVRATSKGCRIVIHANKLNFRGRRTSIDMRDEVTRVSRAELAEIVRLFDQTIEHQIAERIRQNKTTVTID